MASIVPVTSDDSGSPSAPEKTPLIASTPARLRRASRRTSGLSPFVAFQPMRPRCQSMFRPYCLNISTTFAGPDCRNRARLALA